MDFFGIGIFEILLIILIAIIVLGPQDTVKAGRSLGLAVRRFFSSEEWRTLLQATREIRTIPEKLLEETGLDHPEEILPSEAEIRKEAGLDELERDMSQWKADLSAWGNSPVIIPTPETSPEAPGEGAPAPTEGAPDPVDGVSTTASPPQEQPGSTAESEVPPESSSSAQDKQTSAASAPSPSPDQEPT